jgi:hypothetical protein
MRELVAATTDRSLTVEGVGTFRVPPPSVRAGLTVLSVEEGEEADTEALRKVCADWLPLRTQSAVFSDLFTGGRRVQVLRGLVTGSLPRRLQRRIVERTGDADTSEGNGGESVGDVYWQARIAQYRGHFGLTFEEVMAEPFAAFVGQLEQLSLLEAREQRRIAEGGMIAQAGDEEAYDALRSRSELPGVDDEDPDGGPDVETEWDSENEKKKWLQKKMRKAKEIKAGGHRGQNDL